MELMQFTQRRPVLVITLLAVALAPLEADKATSPNPVLDKQFSQTVQPFVAKYCVSCHSGNSPAAQFDIRAYTTMESVVRDHPRWCRHEYRTARLGNFHYGNSRSTSRRRAERS